MARRSVFQTLFMARNANIPFYGLNQNFLRYISFREAKAHISSGRGVPMTSSLTGEVPGWEERDDFQIPAVKMIQGQKSDHDPCFISASEMGGNAERKGKLHSENCGCFGCRAVTKVQAWPYIHDEKAVYVSPVGR